MSLLTGVNILFIDIHRHLSPDPVSLWSRHWLLHIIYKQSLQWLLSPAEQSSIILVLASSYMELSSVISVTVTLTICTVKAHITPHKRFKSVNDTDTACWHTQTAAIPWVWISTAVVCCRCSARKKNCKAALITVPQSSMQAMSHTAVFLILWCCLCDRSQ